MRRDSNDATLEKNVVASSGEDAPKFHSLAYGAACNRLASASLSSKYLSRSLFAGGTYLQSEPEQRQVVHLKNRTTRWMQNVPVKRVHSVVLRQLLEARGGRQQ